LKAGVVLTIAGLRVEENYQSFFFFKVQSVKSHCDYFQLWLIEMVISY